MPAGRPPIFKTPEEMQKAIDAYFERVDASENERVTVSGLAYELGMSRRTFVDYAKKDKFLPTVKRARARIEIAVEQVLMSGQAQAGAIFNLKNNFGWKDKTEQTLDGDLNIRKIERTIVDPANSDS